MSLGKLFENYYNIFMDFGTNVLSESDEIIGYYVFDITDISIGFCSKRVLKCLLGEGIIDEPICDASSLLLAKFRALEGTSLWNVEAVKTSCEWMEVLKLADEIQKMIKIRWTYEELQAIFGLRQSMELNS